MSATHDPNGAPVDPSMDDILASIRRILDEEGTRSADMDDGLEPLAPVSNTAVSASASPVLELDQSMMLSDAHDSTDDTAITHPAPAHEGPAMGTVAHHPGHDSAAAVHAAGPEPSPGPTVPGDRQGLVAPPAAAAAATSVSALMRTLATERGTAVSRQGPTIEDLVRDEMRPLLKEWLDTHLPPLVERLVRVEIERVVSRAS